MSSLHKEGVVWRRGEVGENWEDGREVRVYFMRKESVSNGKKNNSGIIAGAGGSISGV